MKKLLNLMRQYLMESILAPALKLMEALMDLFVPLVVARIINDGIAPGNRGYIVSQVLLLIGLAALGLAFSFTAQYFSAKASVGIASRLRQKLFDHVQSLSYTQLDQMGTSTLITRMTSDINQVQTGINMALRLLLRSPFIVFGSMIMAFTIDVKCALVFAGAIPVLSVVVYGIMMVTIPLYKKVQSRLDEVLATTRENLTGVRVIRAFRKEQDEVQEFDQRSHALTVLNEYVGRISALMNPLTFLLINLATIFLIRQGALRVEIGAIRQGDVVALYNYMAQMIVELIKLASLIITINKAIACAERVDKILDVEPDMTYPQEAGNAVVHDNRTNGEIVPAVEFDHVTFTYQGAAAPSLEDVSFRAYAGETIGIIGATGSGKSSLVNLIPRFYDVTEGKVLVNGIDVRDYPKSALVEKTGIVPQKAVLFQGTIRDNLKWGNPDASDEEIMEAVRIAQAEDVLRAKGGDLAARVEQNGRNHSGGQRQRLTIARALVKKPQILILDDSASALDFATDAALRRAVHELSHTSGQNGGMPMTTFIVSQRTGSVRSADRILVLDDGHLAGSGTHEELLRGCPVYQEIYYSQFPEERPAGRKEEIA